MSEESDPGGGVSGYSEGCSNVSRRHHFHVTFLLVAGSAEETYDTSHPISFLLCVVVLFCFVGVTLGERIS